MSAHAERGAGGAARHLSVTIPGPAGTLEGLLQTSGAEEPELAALVCHPHPLYGGTMHNKVVHRIASVLSERRIAVLRFNFRGAGGSPGSFDQGQGELEDARAAFRWLWERFPEASSWCAGFSFGAWIAARLAAREPAIEKLVLVAPPVTRSSFDVLRSAAVPKLVIQGTGDEVCPPEALEREYPTWAEPKQLIRVEGATHFFDRQLGALAKALREGLFAGR
jgi:alpha/beta superfamily hydrolase